MRKQMRKLTFVSFVFAFIFGFASLGVGQTQYMKQFNGKTIRILAVKMSQYNSLWAMIPEFEKKYGIKVELEESPFAQNREKTLLDMSKGTGRYDIFNVDVMWLAEYAAAGYLEPLMKYIKNPDLTEADFDVDDFVPRIFSGNGVYEDEVYNIPIGAGSVGQTWRKDIAAQYGLTFPERFSGEWTTDKMMEFVKKMHHPEKGVYGYVTQPKRWFWGWTFTQLMYTFTPPEEAGNEFINEDWEVTINNKNTLDALKWYLGLREYLPDGHANFGYDEVLSNYQQGRAAGNITYSEFINDHFENPVATKTAGKNAHMHTPVGPGGRMDPFFGSWGIAISKDSKNKEAAWAFVQWITSKAQQLRALKGGTVPVRHSTYQSEELARYLPWYVPFYEYMLTSANPDERIRIPEWAEISSVMGLYGNKAWIDEITPEEAIAQMEKGIKKRMKRGGYYSKNFKKPKQLWRDLSYYDRKPSEWN